MTLSLDRHLRYSYLAGLRHDVELFYLNIDVAYCTNVITGTEDELGNFFDEYRRGWLKSSLYIKIYLTKRQRKARIAQLRVRFIATNSLEEKIIDLTRRVMHIRMEWQRQRTARYNRAHKHQ